MLFFNTCLSLNNDCLILDFNLSGKQFLCLVMFGLLTSII